MNMPVYVYFSFYDMSVRHSIQLYFCGGSCEFFFLRDRNPQATTSVLD